MLYRSVFEQCYDVAIYGAGYAGLAAAWTLGQQGKRVLLLDRSMDIAWESGRAFARDAGALHDPLWQKFCQQVHNHSGASNNLDPCSAEIIAATQLQDASDQIDVLLGASPIRSCQQEQELSALHVATKSSERMLRAQLWLDASDAGTLFQIAAPQTYAKRRKPQAYEARILLGLAPKGQMPVEFSSKHAFIEAIPHLNAFNLCLRATEPLSQNALLERWQSLRTQAVHSLADRFALGREAARNVPSPRKLDSEKDRCVGSLPEQHLQCDIFVAGAGTGGSIAALTAQAEGHQVLVADSMPIAGGVGTAGLISNYFYGHPGGAHESLDQKGESLQDSHTIPTPRGMHWHPVGKATAFHQKLLDPSHFISEAIIYGAKREGTTVTEIRIATADQILIVHPRTVIDATGDGDVAALAGASYDFGRPGDGLPLSYSQPAYYRQMDNGRLGLYNFDAGWCDPTDPEDLTRARLSALAQYRTLPPGGEKRLVQLAPLPGIRQSRQFHTCERLELADLMNHRSRASSIGVTQAPLDTHSVDFEFEDDETMFWLWGCKSFRHLVHAEMPYGIMTPNELNNLWLACRSAGISPAASYAARMQRDMHRLGEAAAYAASAWLEGIPSQQIPTHCQARLDLSGARAPVSPPSEVDPLELLDQGKPSPQLWKLYQNKGKYEHQILERLRHPSADISWLAAVICAMWNDPRAEARLLQTIQSKEAGIEAPALSRGPFNQHIDVPNWFLAINLLRRCGSKTCLPVLQSLAEQDGNCLNLRTSLALSIERLQIRIQYLNTKTPVAKLLEALVHDATPDTWVRPSRSIKRTLDGDSQRPLPQEPVGIDTSEDHRWQLDLAVARAAKTWDIPSPIDIDPYLADPRACVRKAVQTLLSNQ